MLREPVCRPVFHAQAVNQVLLLHHLRHHRIFHDKLEGLIKLVDYRVDPLELIFRIDVKASNLFNFNRYLLFDAPLDLTDLLPLELHDLAKLLQFAL